MAFSSKPWGIYCKYNGCADTALFTHKHLAGSLSRISCILFFPVPSSPQTGPAYCSVDARPTRSLFVLVNYPSVATRHYFGRTKVNTNNQTNAVQSVAPCCIVGDQSPPLSHLPCRKQTQHADVPEYIIAAHLSFTR